MSYLAGGLVAEDGLQYQISIISVLSQWLSYLAGGLVAEEGLQYQISMISVLSQWLSYLAGGLVAEDGLQVLPLVLYLQPQLEHLAHLLELLGPARGFLAQRPDVARSEHLRKQGLRVLQLLQEPLGEGLVQVHGAAHLVLLKVQHLQGWKWFAVRILTSRRLFANMALK